MSLKAKCVKRSKFFQDRCAAVQLLSDNVYEIGIFAPETRISLEITTIPRLEHRIEKRGDFVMSRHFHVVVLSFFDSRRQNVMFWKRR